jgi:hypothetical protein
MILVAVLSHQLFPMWVLYSIDHLKSVLPIASAIEEIACTVMVSVIVSLNLVNVYKVYQIFCKFENVRQIVG